MSKLETNTIDTVSGTTTLQIGSTNTNTITLGASGDTITVPTGATFSAPNIANKPSFLVKLGPNQTLTDNVTTKIQFGTEIYDTDSVFDSTTNYRFTVPTGSNGKYQVNLVAGLLGSGNTIQDVSLFIYKNGSALVQENYIPSATNPQSGMTISIAIALDLVATDYLEGYARINDTSGSPFVDGETGVTSTYFNAYKLIGD